MTLRKRTLMIFRIQFVIDVGQLFFQSSLTLGFQVYTIDKPLIKLLHMFLFLLQICSGIIKEQRR